MPNYQAEIVANVDARGYRVKRDGIRWTDAQYAARQVAKLTEELAELSAYIHHIQAGHGGPQCVARWELELSTAAIHAESAFDSGTWGRAHIAHAEKAADEAADMLVVLYNLADALGVDLNALALEKSRADVERGVR